MTAPKQTGPLTLPELDVTTARRGDVRLVLARRSAVPLVQVRALLPGAGGAGGRLAAACLLRGPRVRDRLDAIGATAEAAARPDGLLLSVCAEPAHGAALVDLLLELMEPEQPPSAEVVASEAERVERTETMLSGDPGDAARRAALCAAFGATSPYAEQVAADLVAVTPEDVQRWHEQAGPATVVLCGDLRSDASWGDLDGGADVPPPTAIGADARGPRWVARNRPGSTQSTLRAVGPHPRMGSPERAAADVLQRLLGGGRGSRLVHELRERRGFGYHPGTSVVDLARTSYLLLEADVATEVTAAAVAVVDDVLRSVVEEPPDGDELELGRRSVIGDLGRAMDAQGSLAELLLACTLAGAAPSAMAQVATEVSEVSSSTVSAAAAHLIDGLHGTALADLAVVSPQPLPATWGSCP